MLVLIFVNTTESWNPFYSAPIEAIRQDILFTCHSFHSAVEYIGQERGSELN